MTGSNNSEEIIFSHEPSGDEIVGRFALGDIPRVEVLEENPELRDLYTLTSKGAPTKADGGSLSHYGDGEDAQDHLGIGA